MHVFPHRAQAWAVRICVLFTLSIIPFKAQAQFTVVVPAYSVHLMPEKRLTGQNWGIGFEQGLRPNLSLLGEVFRNSHRRKTAVVGVTWVPVKIRRVHLGGSLGLDLTDGYVDNPVKPLIGDAKVVIDGTSRFSMGIDILPAGTGNAKVALGMTLRYTIHRKKVR